MYTYRVSFFSQKFLSIFQDFSIRINYPSRRDSPISYWVNEERTPKGKEYMGGSSCTSRRNSIDFFLCLLESVLPKYTVQTFTVYSKGWGRVNSFESVYKCVLTFPPTLNIGSTTQFSSSSLPRPSIYRTEAVLS